MRFAQCEFRFCDRAPDCRVCSDVIATLRQEIAPDCADLFAIF